MPGPGGRGWGVGRKVPAAHNSRTIHGIEIKFGRVVENCKVINFWSDLIGKLRHNDVTTVEILEFYEILSIKIRKI